MNVRRPKSVYLEGCPSLPPDLASAAAGEPTPEQEAEIATHLASITTEIRRRRDAYEREHGPIDWDD